MEFEWDEAKRQLIIESRGIDLLKAARIFDGRVLSAVDERQDYGEVRYRAIGDGRRRLLRLDLYTT